MSHAEAIQTLRHASRYIFSSQIARSPGKTIRGRAELWQAMATLDECRNAVQREACDTVVSSGSGSKAPRLTLVCGLRA